MATDSKGTQNAEVLPRPESAGPAGRPPEDVGGAGGRASGAGSDIGVPGAGVGHAAAGTGAAVGVGRGAGTGSPRRREARRARPIPPKRYRIGEVVEFAGVSRQTIHNYTTMGLLRECQWTEGGHRLYDEEVFDRLAVIAELKAKHRSLTDIRGYFEKHQDPDPSESDGSPLAPSDG